MRRTVAQVAGRVWETARRGTAVAALGVAASSSILYLCTLTPGLSSLEGDSHELTVAAATLGLPHPIGYPLYVWIGFLFTLLPVGEVAYRTNLLSAVSAAGGAGLVALAAGEIGLPPFLAAFAGLVLATSTTFWSQAVVTEVYTVNTAAFVLTVWLLLRATRPPGRSASVLAARRFALAAAIVFGASLGLHLSNLAFAPVYLSYAALSAPHLRRDRRLLALALAALAAGAAQFAWLPLRADFAAFPNPRPDTWSGFYRYTLGAFAETRFAYPLEAFAGRLVFYQTLALRDFTPAGALLACAGMWRQAWIAPGPFWLLFGVYAVNVLLAAQVGVPDSEVFFLPAHAVFALFAAVGADAVRALAHSAVADRLTPRRRQVLVATGASLLLTALVSLAAYRFPHLDRRADTAVGDFLRAMFAAVPAGSEILAGRGIFGQDVAYWRRWHGGTEHVVLPSIEPALPATSPAPRFVKARLADSRLDPAARWGLSEGALPSQPWAVACVVGAGRGLVLYRVHAEPPPLVHRAADPAHRLDVASGAHRLVGYTVAATATADRRVRLRTYWRLAEGRPPVVMTAIAGTPLESHEVGRGNWQRARAEMPATPEGAFVEEFDLVLPSHLVPGSHRIDLGLVEFGMVGPAIRWIPLGSVTLE